MRFLSIKGKSGKEGLRNKKIIGDNLKVKTIEDKLITSYCNAFPGSKVSQNDCRMWNMSYKYKTICTVQLQFSHKKTQENTVVTHEAIQKYIHIYTSILSNYAICTTFKWLSHFSDDEVVIN
jgi:hypothetical protein